MPTKSKRKSSPKPESSPTSGVKLRRLVIENFKAIDRLELDFPAPLMEDDPDVTVIGSRNGVGKTSVLEACALLLTNAICQEGGFLKADPPHTLDPLLRTGSTRMEVVGTLEFNEEQEDIKFGYKIHMVDVFSELKEGGRIPGYENRYYPPISRESLRVMLDSLLGFETEPFILPPVLYFHSYRKTREGNLEPGMLTGESQTRSSRNQETSKKPQSTFKQEILRTVMARGEIFENVNQADAEQLNQVLNSLLEEYAGGRVEKLRTSPDNTIDILITPTDGSPPFSFDGLSSGQKEIISTLFLIWRHTHDDPGIVLIDEPELHLNAEWHRGIVRQLFKLVPENQYIIATHSKSVFGSVDADRRIILEPNKDGRA